MQKTPFVSLSDEHLRTMMRNVKADGGVVTATSSELYSRLTRLNEVFFDKAVSIDYYPPLTNEEFDALCARTERLRALKRGTVLIMEAVGIERWLVPMPE